VPKPLQIHPRALFDIDQEFMRVHIGIRMMQQIMLDRLVISSTAAEYIFQHIEHKGALTINPGGATLAVGDAIKIMLGLLDGRARSFPAFPLEIVLAIHLAIKE